MQRPGLVVAFMVLAVVMGATCTKNHTNPHSEVRKALELARERWATQIPDSADYDLTVNIGCFCPDLGEYVLHVRGGLLESVEARRADAPVNELVKNLEPYTVDGLFRQIDQALAANAEVVEARFDRNYGYAVAIKVDENSSVFDDEFEVTASLVVAAREARR